MKNDIYLDNIKLTASEMCFVQYLPIKMAGKWVEWIPENLLWMEDLLCYISCKKDDYIYLTVKHLYVTPDNVGNRAGWHIDGYLSDDVNYIWYDKHPTEICDQEFVLSKDHELALQEMEDQAKEENIITFPENSVLRLDNTVVHRSPIITEGGMRTFVKISVSKHKYNLAGNAHNYLFDYNWSMYPRNESRNHPYILEEDNEIFN